MSKPKSPFVVKQAFPHMLEQYISSMQSAKFPAFLFIDRELKLLQAGGALERYAIPDLKYGAQINKSLAFLEGADDIHCRLTQFSLQAFPGVYADVHYLPLNEGEIVVKPGVWSSMYVLLLDVTHESIHHRNVKKYVMQEKLKSRNHEN